MVYIADGDDNTKRVTVIGVNKYESTTFKVIHTSSVKVGRHEKIVSHSVTSTNHLIASFSNGSALMMYLDNFRDIHFKRPSNESIIITMNDYVMVSPINNFKNVGLCHFTEFFLNI